jgi:hypothetical protein
MSDGFWPAHHTDAGTFGQWDAGSEVVTFVAAEIFEDFISFWMPLRGLERDGRWVRASQPLNFLHHRHEAGGIDRASLAAARRPCVGGGNR